LKKVRTRKRVELLEERELLTSRLPVWTGGAETTNRPMIENFSINDSPKSKGCGDREDRRHP